MKNFMNSVKRPRVGRNIFDLSHELKASYKFGYLYPGLAMELAPGEKVRLQCEDLTRLAPMVAPVMHNMYGTIHFFFVPNRLCWANWEQFITHQDAGTQPAHPYLVVNADGSNYTEMMDHLGIPKPKVDSVQNLEVDAMPFQAYQLVWKDFFRDQNVTPAAGVVDGLQDGDNSALTNQLNILRRRAWAHDYFTSCLPTPQQGPAIEIPIGDMPIKVNSTSGDASIADANLTYPNFTITDSVTSNTDVPADQLYAEGSEGNTTIEDLRRASAIQRFFEKIMRTGRRYTEVISGIFGTTAQDARLQRPEYITGVRSGIAVSEVLNTTGTIDLPQGNMSGHGISIQRGKSSDWYTAREHGWVIAVHSYLPKTAYQDGQNRSFFRKTYFSYPWPDFANLGEMAVQNREVYAYTAADNGTFGYLPQYAHFKTMYDRVAGDFRDTLDFWHYGRKFSALPGLNEDFIYCNPGKRIFAVTDPEEDEIYAHTRYVILKSSFLPKYATPVLY